VHNIIYFIGLLTLTLSCGQREADKPIMPVDGMLLRGPYLQAVTDTSIRIVFYTAELTASALVLKEDNGKARHFSLNKPGLRHSYLLKGLQPGATYRYSLQVDGKSYSGDHWHFRTAPNHDSAAVTFWTMGDFGAGNENQRKVRLAFQDYLAQQPVNFWIWLGDNAYPDGTLAQFHNKTFDRYYGYDSLMKFLPIYPTPGNHDYNGMKKRGGNFHRHSGPYYDLVETFEQGEGGGVPSGTQLYYSFDYGPVHFVSLNSEVWRFSVLGHQQMKVWLEKDLAANSKKWTVVFFHQPPYSFGSHSSDTHWEVVIRGMRKKYLPIIEKYNADLVLSGHSHVYERSYLLHGHYEKSGKMGTHHIVSKGNTLNGIDVYEKNGIGTLYAVAGSGGKSHPKGVSPHPVMAFGYGGKDKCGSLIISIQGDSLKGEFLTSTGEIADRFAVVKP
jgi:acid phosphatase type 7